VTTNTVERALASGPREAGVHLASIPEDQWFERKSVRVAPKDFAATLVAFGNAEGGTVVVGIHDGQIEGTKGHVAKVNALRQAPFDLTTPPVRTRFDQVAVDVDGRMDTLLVARVEPGSRVHELTNGDCYLRVGDESRRLNFTQRQELHYDRGSAHFDGEVAKGVTVSQLDAELLRGYRESAGASGTNTRLLRARGLVTERDEVTNAGYLLFAPHPGERFPQAHVRVIAYLGTDRGTGSRLGIDDQRDVRVEGPIPTVIAQAAEIIRFWQPTRRALSERGRFEGVPIVPEDAWLEGLVNAVIHRSYSLGGDHIRVEIFPNRIEIESPGRFPGLADPSRPLEISRYARNPRIARVCTDLKISQELGEGIRRMFQEMRERGLSDPAFTQSSGSVRLALYGTSRLDPETEARLPKRALTVLDEIRKAAQPLGTGDLQSILGFSRPSMTKYLGALRDEGLIEWQGRSANDPRAVWVIAHQ
jgi:ATP-dependent DNA helicase RecG